MCPVRGSINLVVVLSLVLSNAACSTVRPLEIPTGEIQERVLSGQLIGKGDRVDITTKDGKVHTIKVALVRDPTKALPTWVTPIRFIRLAHY